MRTRGKRLRRAETRMDLAARYMCARGVWTIQLSTLCIAVFPLTSSWLCVCGQRVRGAVLGPTSYTRVPGPQHHRQLHICISHNQTGWTRPFAFAPA